MLEIEKYIKKHVGRKVLLTLTFSPSPTVGTLSEKVVFFYNFDGLFWASFLKKNIKPLHF